MTTTTRVEAPPARERHLSRADQQAMRDDRRYQAGYDVGASWARDSATSDALANLADLADRQDRSGDFAPIYFVEICTAPYDRRDELFIVAYPDQRSDVDACRRFWRDRKAEHAKRPDATPGSPFVDDFDSGDDYFVQGFFMGAVDLWRTIRPGY